MRISSADWFKAGVARQRVGPISLGIAPRACMILSKLLLFAWQRGGQCGGPSDPARGQSAARAGTFGTQCRRCAVVTAAARWVHQPRRGIPRSSISPGTRGQGLSPALTGATATAWDTGERAFCLPASRLPAVHVSAA